jgi:hypothetical protein
MIRETEDESRMVIDVKERTSSSYTNVQHFSLEQDLEPTWILMHPAQ